MLYTSGHALLIMCLAISMLVGPETSEKRKIQLVYEVIPEGDDFYSLSWTDTLGLGEGYLPAYKFMRPLEIWCYVTNMQHDTLGYYKGLSTARTFCYFQTTDSMVTFHFMIGLNMLSDKFEHDTPRTRAYWAANKVPRRFEPITCNLQQDVRKQIEVVLSEQ